MPPDTWWGYIATRDLSVGSRLFLSLVAFSFHSNRQESRRLVLRLIGKDGRDYLPRGTNLRAKGALSCALSMIQ